MPEGDLGEKTMLDKDCNNPIERHKRTAVILVALCSLSVGISIGVILRGGIAGAGSEDNRLTISSAPPPGDALSAAFARAAEQVEPSVVHIKVIEGEGLGRFAREGTGSGLIVSPSGYIITNYHVIRRASKIQIKLFSGEEYEAKVIGQDAETDLAVLKIEANSPLPAAKMGDSDKLKVGDWVLAIGSPFGLEQTVTAGIISAKDRVTGSGSTPFQQFLQTDAAINPGNSGGPLINLAGEVIGINTQIATSSGSYNGVGFALPSRTAVEVYNQIISFGRVRRGFLGIYLEELKPQVARLNKVEEGQGVLVKDVTSEDSPAARAGIRSGDIIIGLNGQKVSNVREFIRSVAALQIGTNATVTFVRDGQKHTVTVKIEERRREEEPPEIMQMPFDPHHPRGLPQTTKGIGLKVRTLTAEQARLRGLEGVRGAMIVEVEPGSPAHQNGAEAGDILTQINNKPVHSEEDFLRLTRELKSGDDVVLKVLRRAPSRRPTSIIIAFTMP
jgi:serine protease Do